MVFKSEVNIDQCTATLVAALANMNIYLWVSFNHLENFPFIPSNSFSFSLLRFLFWAPESFRFCCSIFSIPSSDGNKIQMKTLTHALQRPISNSSCVIDRIIMSFTHAQKLLTKENVYSKSFFPHRFGFVSDFLRSKPINSATFYSIIILFYKSPQDGSNSPFKRAVV